MPPLLAPQFFIGQEPPKDVWVTKLLESKEKDIGHEQSKGRAQDTESHDWRWSEPHSTGYPVVKKQIYWGGEIFLLTFAYKDVYLPHNPPPFPRNVPPTVHFRPLKLHTAIKKSFKR